MTTSPHPAADLLVPRRFCGPPSSGNGGWTAGALAALIDHDCPDDRARSWPTIRVALRQPPPLDTPMTVGDEDGTTVASIGGAVVARADVVDEEVPAVEPVPAAEARAARAAYPGLASHPFPTCFACGTGREEGDGLRIFPGRRLRGRHPDRRHLDPAPQRRRGLPHLRRRAPAGLARHHLGRPGLHRRVGG
jgi:hypothetical protein